MLTMMLSVCLQHMTCDLVSPSPMRREDNMHALTAAPWVLLGASVYQVYQAKYWPSLP